MAPPSLVLEGETPLRDFIHPALTPAPVGGHAAHYRGTPIRPTSPLWSPTSESVGRPNPDSASMGGSTVARQFKIGARLQNLGAFHRSHVTSEQGSREHGSGLRLQVFETAIVCLRLRESATPSRDHGNLSRSSLIRLGVWVLVVGLVEFIPVPMWRGTYISMGFPLLMVVAFLYQAPAAALAALLAASDPRELKREVGILRALFNRCQVALSVFVASHFSTRSPRLRNRAVRRSSSLLGLPQ